MLLLLRRLRVSLLKKRKRRKRDQKLSLSFISEERRSNKKRLLKLAEEYSSKDGESAIVAKPMNAIVLAAKPATRVSRPIEMGIVIREPLSQAQTKQQTEAETSNEDEDLEYKCKGKKKLKKAAAETSKVSTSLPLRRAKKEATENKLREEA